MTSLSASTRHYGDVKSHIWWCHWLRCHVITVISMLQCPSPISWLKNQQSVKFHQSVIKG